MEGWGLKLGLCPTTHSSPKRPHQHWVVLHGSAMGHPEKGHFAARPSQSSMKRGAPQLSGPPGRLQLTS